MADVRCVVEASNILGEAPVWCPIERALYWVEWGSHEIFRLDHATCQTTKWEVVEGIGCLALRECGGAIVASRTGFWLFDFESGAAEPLCDPEPEQPNNFFSDGKCDRRGRFWAGSMVWSDALPMDQAAGGGALYRLDSDRRCQRVVEGLTIFNGPAWSPDDRTMYFADSAAKTIFACDYDLDTGEIGPRRVFATSEGRPGLPDGMTIDSEGFLWSAEFQGWRVVRYAPDGRIDRVIEMPVEQPTSCMFGGEGLDILFVTSARWRLTDKDLTRQCSAGGLFAVEVGVKGLPEPRFAG